jgi:hypothetical protein
MSTISHQPTSVTPESQRWSRFLITEVWASLAITMMWVAVAVSAVWGPNLVASSNDGNSTTIPSGIIVALFAWLGSWAVAKHAFTRREED